MKINVKKALIIFVFCLIVGGFLWIQHSMSVSIMAERKSIEALSKQESTLKGAVSRKYALLDSYRDILQKVEAFQFSFPADNVAFFASLERIMAGNELKIIKVNPVSKPSAPDRTGVQVTCEGDYYRLLNAVSEMRDNKMIVCLSSLRITGNGSGPVSADMSVETIMRGK